MALVELELIGNVSWYLRLGVQKKNKDTINPRFSLVDPSYQESGKKPQKTWKDFKNRLRNEAKGRFLPRGSGCLRLRF
jgi:hypothetical protein